ncbi:MAG: nucleotidyltransferase domain-containing protein [Gallionella sp.]|nr:nucleotidyltransferase domain-containing protein [Gallionella sp.]
MSIQTVLNREAIVQILQVSVPNILAIYAFGSRVQGTAGLASDLDLAVLVSGYAEPVALWRLSGELADIAGCAVDLLDLRAASTVMQYQILISGERWWAKDVQAALFESAILSEKTELDTARTGLLEDIQKEGKIYG